MTKKGFCIASFLEKASHVRMVVVPAKDAQKVGTGDDDSPAGTKNSGHFIQQGDGVLDVLQDVESSDHIDGMICKGQCAAIVEMEVARMLASQSQVRLRNLDTKGLTALFGQGTNNLPDPATDIQDDRACCLKSK